MEKQEFQLGDIVVHGLESGYLKKIGIVRQINVSFRKDSENENKMTTCLEYAISEHLNEDDYDYITEYQLTEGKRTMIKIGNLNEHLNKL